MQKLQITKNYTAMGGEFRKKGEIIEVSNNIAFGLIDKGVARIFKSPKNKMMKPSIKRRYKIK